MSITGVYQIDVQKQMAGEYWTNRYHVEAGSFTAALAAGEEIADCERQQSLSSVTFVSVRASTPEAGDDAFIVAPLGYSGAISGAGISLPLFVVARAIFVKGPGRPDIKYLKAMMNTDALDSPFTIKDNVVTGINNGYLANVFAVEGLCSADGTTYTSASVDKRVGMRQLRRGSKRKLQPIIPTGEPELFTADEFERPIPRRVVRDARETRSATDAGTEGASQAPLGDEPRRRLHRDTELGTTS